MKNLEVYMTRTIQLEIDPGMLVYLSTLVNSLFIDWPFDMFVFEPYDTGYMQVRLAGYNFENNQLDETTIIATTKIKINRKFWFKIDDYGDCYIGTFLFPEEY